MKPLYYLLFVLGMTFLSTNTLCAKKDVPLKYEISCAGSGTQGYYIVKVKATVEKKGDISEALLKRCAVHGVLFRGYGPGQGCTSQRPMADSQTESKNKKYFASFFAPDGMSENYAMFVEGSMQTARQGKKTYIVTGIVSVAKDLLRKDLEAAGKLKSLSSGF